ncbi:MAG TPA: YwaF family protein [Haloplasmataceae bacterium]
MKEFFRFDQPNFYNLSFLELIIPITIVYTIVLILVIYRDKIKEKKNIDTFIRITMGVMLLSLFVSYYILVWSYEGINKHNLPLSLYSICCILCILLTFTKKRFLFSITLYMGIIIGMINMLTNTVGYSYMYYRYYQLMISNGLIILIPLYFLIVHEYLPKLKETFISLILYQVMILLILLVNYNLKTYYSNLIIGENMEISPVNNVLYYLGDWPWYLIWSELIGITLIFIIYTVIYLVNIQYTKAVNERVSMTKISTQSIYMKKKKK